RGVSRLTVLFLITPLSTIRRFFPSFRFQRDFPPRAQVLLRLSPAREERFGCVPRRGLVPRPCCQFRAMLRHAQGIFVRSEFPRPSGRHAGTWIRDQAAFSPGQDVGYGGKAWPIITGLR